MFDDESCHCANIEKVYDVTTMMLSTGVAVVVRELVQRMAFV